MTDEVNYYFDLANFGILPRGSAKVSFTWQTALTCVIDPHKPGLQLLVIVDINLLQTRLILVL